VKILRALIPALKDRARVIIADVCIPPKGVVSKYKEHWMRYVWTSSFFYLCSGTNQG
jgi:hypothetical protein